MALETLADKSAAKPLAELLQKPGLRGHAVTTIDAALEANPASRTDTTTRNQALKELYLARALYRCGDYEGLGEKTLREYSRRICTATTPATPKRFCRRPPARWSNRPRRLER